MSKTDGAATMAQQMGDKGAVDIPAPSGATRTPTPAAPKIKAPARGPADVAQVTTTAGQAIQQVARAADTAGTASTAAEPADAARIGDAFRPAKDPFASPAAGGPAAADGTKFMRAIGPAAGFTKTVAATLSLADALTQTPSTPAESRARDLQVLTALMDMASGLSGLASVLENAPPVVQRMLEKFGGITGAVSSVVKLTQMYQEVMNQPGGASGLQMTKIAVEAANLAGNLMIGFGAFNPTLLGVGRGVTLAAAGANLAIMGYENREILIPAAQNAASRDGMRDVYDYWIGDGLKARPTPAG